MKPLTDPFVKSGVYLKELENAFGVIRYDAKPARQWYSRDEEVFFDCGISDLRQCLNELLKRRNLTHFSVFVVAKESKGDDKIFHYILNSITYVNLGEQSIQDFTNHFLRVLEYPLSLELQLSGLEYIKHVGFSYSTPEEAVSLEKQLAANT